MTDNPAPAREARDGPRSQHAGPAGTGTRPGRGRIEDEERDELAALISRAQARAGQEQADAVRARRLPAAMRLEYDEAAWAARNPGLAGSPGEQRRDAYYSYRFHRWLERNAGRMAEVPDADRHERFRGDESWWRYRNHLPPLDDQERAAFREWAELDADDAEEAYLYRLLPERLYEAYDGSQGPLDWDSFYARYLDQLHGDEPDAAEAGTASEAAMPQGAGTGSGPRPVPGDGALSGSEAHTAGPARATMIIHPGVRPASATAVRSAADRARPMSGSTLMVLHPPTATAARRRCRARAARYRHRKDGRGGHRSPALPPLVPDRDPGGVREGGQLVCRATGGRRRARRRPARSCVSRWAR